MLPLGLPARSLRANSKKLGVRGESRHSVLSSRDMRVTVRELEPVAAYGSHAAM
jgi:hypothetical protein